MSDTELQHSQEMARLRTEVDILAAEAKVEQHECDDAEVALYVVLHPESRLARLEAEVRGYARERRNEPRPAKPHIWTDPEFVQLCIASACYGWRREYGEWPSFQNLADRLAEDHHIPRALAERRIRAAINEPSDRAHLHAIRSGLLAQILSDDAERLGPWQAGEESSLRFWIKAESMTDLVVSWFHRKSRKAVA